MPAQPAAIAFDVNETLPEMSVLGGRFAETGAPSFPAKVWFAGVLRDGSALASAGDRARFAEIAAADTKQLCTELKTFVLVLGSQDKTGAPLRQDQGFQTPYTPSG